MIEIIYRVVSFHINVKRVLREILEGHGKKANHKNLLHEHDNFFLSPHLHQVYFALNIMWNGVALSTSNILRTTRAMPMNFCIFNTPRCQILILGC